MFLDDLESLEELIKQNTVQELMLVIIFHNIKVKSVMNQEEMFILQNEKIIFSNKVLAWSFWNSYNRVKEEQML